jgi:periplasmic protein TonB
VGVESKKKGSLPRSLAIALAAHALLFLFLAHLIPHGPAVFYAPSITFVEAQTTGSGGAKGNGDRKATPKAVMAAASTIPAVLKPTPQPQAPAPQPQAAQSAQQAPAATPTASLPASSSGSPNQVASGASSASGPTGASGSGGSGSGTANAFDPETDADPLTPIADINPVPMWSIAASYPSSARRLGQQGLVKVETDIDAKGLVVASRVAVSSGFPSLDNAALNAVQQARFLPAMKNGRAVASKVLIPVRFQLTKQ